MADTLIQGTTIIEDKRSEKGLIWSCAGAKFNQWAGGDTIWHNTGGAVLTASNDATNMICSVELPNATFITSVIVTGNDATNSFILYRHKLSDNSDISMASANVNTEDTSISNEIIDNSTYSYYIVVDVDLNDTIYGARIKYTY